MTSVRASFVATLLVAAFLVAVGSAEPLAAATRIVDWRNWTAASPSAGAAAMQTARTVLARIPTVALRAHAAPTPRPFMQSGRTWIGDFSVRVSDLNASASASIVRAGAALTHDATAPPPSLLA